jgi:adenylate kinase family enzyme
MFSDSRAPACGQVVHRYGRLVPELISTDPLPWRPQRIVIAGTSGSGKTMLAARVAAALGIPHIEIDSLFHGPGWTARPEFKADVRDFTSQPEWVTEWQYRQVRPLLVERAELMVWLDYSRPLVMRRVARRTLRRRVHRERLWNGNIEGPLWTIFTDRDHIVRWAWRTHHELATRVQDVVRAHPDLPIVRLRSPKETDRWLIGPLRIAAALPPRDN